MVQVNIKNSGTAEVTGVTLETPALASVWEMEQNQNELTLPSYRARRGIDSGDSHSFGYVIMSASVGVLSVKSVSCGDTTTQPTSAPTTRPTSAPTTRPTSVPTTVPTTAPTAAPTKAPTTAPTKAPTTAPTKAPTTAPTKAPTTAPTKAPTTAPTTAPTNGPTSAPGGRMCPAGSVWTPTPGTTWQWQLTGTIDQSLDVQMYDIDLFDSSASLISQLHAKGRAVICYFSTQYEDWRPDAKNFPSSVLGSNLDDWPGERYVDIRSPTLRALMTARLDLAVSKGCDGVEPDNVDSYANSNGLGLKAADQIDFNKFIAAESHKRGLSVGLKNDLDQVSALVPFFDWALNEQCNEYGECSMLKPFVTANKAVFGVEYEGSAGSVCPSMVSSKFSWLMKDLNLGAKGTQCCTYASGGCAKASYSCVKFGSKRSVLDDEESALVEEVAAEEISLVAEVAAEDEELVAEVVVAEVAPEEVVAVAEVEETSAASVVAPVALFAAAAVVALAL